MPKRGINSAGNSYYSSGNGNYYYHNASGSEYYKDNSHYHYTDRSGQNGWHYNANGGYYTSGSSFRDTNKRSRYWFDRIKGHLARPFLGPPNVYFLDFTLKVDDNEFWNSLNGSLSSQFGVNVRKFAWFRSTKTQYQLYFNSNTRVLVSYDNRYLCFITDHDYRLKGHLSLILR